MGDKWQKEVGEQSSNERKKLSQETGMSAHCCCYKQGLFYHSVLSFYANENKMLLKIV